MSEKEKKERLDIVLVERGLAPSRERAKTIIMTGNVFVNGQREDKVGTRIDQNTVIEIKGSTNPFVSRGGLKLDKAIKSFGIDLQNLIGMDVGASTGGFTDCMLQNGARKVYAIDVGYGQLDWKLRTDPRVVCMEKTNIRYVTHEQVPDLIEFATIDVSFISLTKVLQPVYDLLMEDAKVVCLIKPQFEAGREKVGKKGVVREISTHYEVIHKIIDYVTCHAYHVIDLSYSPIKGPEGNIEYLLLMQKKNFNQELFDYTELIKKTVDNAHEKL